MCIAFFLWEHPAVPDLQLVCLFNRDELLARPTEASHFWRDQPGVLGGRDLVAGGTWLCVSERGRAAFLTNFRGLKDQSRPDAPSRGALPVGFVSADGEAPEAFFSRLDGEAYAGFNLIGADLAGGKLLYYCNKHSGSNWHAGSQAPLADQQQQQQQQRQADGDGAGSSAPCGRLHRVPPGLHGVTNGHMDAHWPKVDEGQRRLQELIDSGAFQAPACSPSSSSQRKEAADCGGHGGSSEGAAAGQGQAADPSRGSGADDCPGSSASDCGNGGGCVVPWEQLFSVMRSHQHLESDPAKLPQTGYGAEFETANSGIYVQPVSTPWGPFGTRSQIVLAVWRDGRGELRERYRSPDGSWQEVQHRFEVQVGGGSRAGRGESSGGGGKQGAPAGS